MFSLCWVCLLVGGWAMYTMPRKSGWLTGWQCGAQPAGDRVFLVLSWRDVSLLYHVDPAVDEVHSSPEASAACNSLIDSWEN